MRGGMKTKKTFEEALISDSSTCVHTTGGYAILVCINEGGHWDEMACDKNGGHGIVTPFLVFLSGMLDICGAEGGRGEKKPIGRRRRKEEYTRRRKKRRKPAKDPQ